MKELAPSVWQVSLPPNPVNVYVVGDVLVDSALPYDAGRIMRQLDGHDLTAHAVTHAHPDHIGSSRAICERLGLTYLVGERDVAVAEDPGLLGPQMTPLPRNALSDLILRATCGPGHPVDRGLTEGDEVAGFEVLDMPGHTPGHVALWREADRVLVAGDVLWNLTYGPLSPGLTVPFGPVNSDSAALRDSIRRIAELEPELALFGHGPPLRDPAGLADLAAGLPG